MDQIGSSSLVATVSDVVVADIVVGRIVVDVMVGFASDDSGRVVVEKVDVMAKLVSLARTVAATLSLLVVGTGVVDRITSAQSTEDPVALLS